MFLNELYWYVGAVIIGVVIGFIIDTTKEKEYGANMFIETNFSSTRQVYENINQFHQLADKDKDTLELSKKIKYFSSGSIKVKGFLY